MKTFAQAAALAAFLFSAPSASQEVGDGSEAPRWVQEESVDLGTFLEGETAKGKFEFENPREQAHEIRSVHASCTCSKARVVVGDRIYTVENEPRPNTLYRTQTVDGVEQKEEVAAIPVGPGEKGRVEVEIDLRGINGPKEATITLNTSDEKQSVLTLRAKAVATQFFNVMPPEVNFNQMNWKDEREFLVQITSPIRGDFEIVGHDELPKQMAIEYHKEMRGDQAVWIVEGKYGPNVDPDAPGGIIQLHTDVEGRKVPIRVIAFVTGPLEVRPGTWLGLGRIRKGEGTTGTYEFEPTDADFDLQLEGFELSGLTIDEKFVSVTSRKEGKILYVDVTISPDAPQRLVRGDLTLRLNHPAAAVQQLQFNGFVR